MDLAHLLLPGDDELSRESLHRDEETLCFFVVVATDVAGCPACVTLSTRVHSRYRRTLTDLPCCASLLRLVW